MAVSGVSPLPREARVYQGQRAGLVTRMAAAGLDVLVVVVLLLLGYGGASVFRFLLDPRSFTFPDMGLLLSMTSAFIVAVVYQSFAWWISGRTYGALVMGLRVVNRQGERLRFMGSCARAVACVVFPIGILWVAVSRENRSAQDVLLRTSVVYDWMPPGR